MEARPIPFSLERGGLLLQHEPRPAVPLNAHPVVMLCKSVCIICSSDKGYMKCKLLPLERVLLVMCLKLYENHQGYENKGLGKIRHNPFIGTCASRLM